MVSTTLSRPDFQTWLCESLVDHQQAALTDKSLATDAEDLVGEIPAHYIRDAIIKQISGEITILSGIRVERYKILGDLHLENLNIDFPVFLQNCNIHGSLYLWGMNSGSISLVGTSVAGEIDLRTTSINGHLLLRRGFSVDGPLIARDLSVSGTVDLQGSSLLYSGSGEFTLANEAEGESFGFSRSSAAALYWKAMRDRPGAKVNLRDARVTSFQHDIGSPGWENNWPRRGNLIIEGFKYEKMSQCTVEAALSWLELQESETSSSYAALANTFEMANAHSATETVQAKAKKYEISTIPNRLKRWFYWIVYSIVGYGRKPERAFWLLVLVFFLHLAIVLEANRQGLFAPAVNRFLLEPCYFGPTTSCDKDISSWKTVEISPGGNQRFVPPAYPGFSPVEYAIERFVPFLVFGQLSFWEPTTAFLKTIFALSSAIGVFLGGVFVGAVTGLIAPRTKR